MNLLKRKTGESSETQSTTMEVYFSGPSVDEHSMSVRDLAPALIGLADAIDRYKELSCPFADLDVRIIDDDPALWARGAAAVAIQHTVTDRLPVM